MIGVGGARAQAGTVLSEPKKKRRVTLTGH